MRAESNIGVFYTMEKNLFFIFLGCTLRFLIVGYSRIKAGQKTDHRLIF